MSVQEYVAWQESIGRWAVILCPWCGDWEDIAEGFFKTDADGTLRFWCCWGCESMPSRRGEEDPCED